MTTNDSESSDQTVLIIGGGIGGLSAAIALQDVGFDVEVYEQAQELREVGASLTLWRDVLEALDVLGGHEAAVQAGATFRAAEFRTPDGDLLLRFDLDSLDLPPTDGDLPNLIALHRAELQRILRDRVGDGVVHLDHECVGVEQDGGQVTGGRNRRRPTQGGALSVRRRPEGPLRESRIHRRGDRTSLHRGARPGADDGRERGTRSPRRHVSEDAVPGPSPGNCHGPRRRLSVPQGGV